MSSTLAAVSSSNLSYGQKSAIRRMYERLGGSSAIGRVKSHAMGTAHAIRQGGESLIVGGALGALHQQMGLDVSIQGKVTIPVDGAVGAVGLLGGIALAHEEYGADLYNMGSAAAAVFAFRKTAEFVAKKKGQPVRAAGESGYEFGAESEDPIVSWARNNL